MKYRKPRPGDEEIEVGIEEEWDASPVIAPEPIPKETKKVIEVDKSNVESIEAKESEPRYKIGDIYKDDVEELYVIAEVFTRTCIVCPLVNKECFACEIMEFSSMEAEGWVRVGTTI